MIKPDEFALIFLNEVNMHFKLIDKILFYQ